jgi:hypothetical protein
MRKQFRCGVVRTTAGGAQRVVRTLLQRRHAEVGNLDLACAIQQDVLGLEVSMTDIVRVAVAYGAHDLPEQKDGVFLRYRTTGVDEVEEIAFFDVFEQQITGIQVSEKKTSLTKQVDSHFRPVLPDIVQFDDVGVFSELHDGNLTLDCQRHATYSIHT